MHTILSLVLAIAMSPAVWTDHPLIENRSPKPFTHRAGQPERRTERLYEVFWWLLQSEDPAGLLPRFSKPLHGIRQVRICNLNDFSVTAGIRSEVGGKNLTIPANATRLAYLPDGTYDLYFVYSNRPKALFRVDTVTLNGNRVEIQLWGPSRTTMGFDN